jgi:hypothetical protein
MAATPHTNEPGSATLRAKLAFPMLEAQRAQRLAHWRVVLEPLLNHTLCAGVNVVCERSMSKLSEHWVGGGSSGLVYGPVCEWVGGCAVVRVI